MDRKEAVNQCICSMCPSFYDCSETVAFCLADSGKSKCIVTETGCICPACPVQVAMQLKHMFYCTRGSEKELNSKQ